MSDTHNNNKTDPLLDCLEILAKLEKRPFSAEAIKAGLPLVQGNLTPELFIRAAERMGYSSRIMQKPLAKISSLVLPAVLILKDNNACVLTKIHDDHSMDIIFPESGTGVQRSTFEELTESYGGFVIYVKPEYAFEERAEQYHKVEGKSWFWGTIFQYKKIYMQVFLAAFLTNIFVLVAPLFIMNVYDRVVPNQAMVTLWALALGALTFFVFDLVTRLLRSYLVDMVGRKADIILSGKLFQQMLGLRMEDRPVSTGGFANYFNQFEALREFFMSATLIAFIDLPFTFLFLFVIWWIGGAIVTIPLIAVPVVIIVALLLEMPARRSIKTALSGANAKNALLIESISGLEMIKTLASEGLMQRRWEESVASATNANTLSRFYASLVLNFTIWIQQIVTIGIIVHGVYLINAGDLTVGGLIAATILGGRALMMSQVANLLTRMERSYAALKSLNSIMALPQERDTESPQLHRPIIHGKIEMDKMTFFYPNQRLPALENVTCSIAPGERVAVIGAIGSGKSTLLKMIVGLYHPSAGSLLIDGTDASEIDIADLRTNIHYVAQDSTLFYGSIRDNILMAKPSVSDEALITASKLAGVDDFVKHHPDGYNLEVGERGENLSGGQRQAVALARALLYEPAVLLLDEPTSNVDNRYEARLIDTLTKYLQDKTLVMVTHRMSLLKLVERIIVLERGNIVADGPKDTILEALRQSQQIQTGE